MKRFSLIPPAAILLIGILQSCIDPFNPRLKDFQSLLVVDALVTDDETSYYVKLNRTIEKIKDEPEKVTGAIVTITDDEGNSTLLTEVIDGSYMTDRNSFRGVAGRNYRLHISTKEGQVYESDPCLLSAVRDVDTVYYERWEQMSDDLEEVLKGVRILTDSKGLPDNRYYRWTYEEWWKFRVPFPKRYDYISQDEITEIENPKIFCWKHRKSDDILIQSTIAGSEGEITRKPVTFIPLNKSDRMTVQYCIQVNQYAISREEYEFWDHMRQINESGGDIFDKQPFQIISNIHNVSDPDEPVVGYFQVAGVKHRKKYITRSEIDTLKIPNYSYGCELIILGPEDPQPIRIPPPVTFDKIYQVYTSLDYMFIEPQYEFPQTLRRLIFTSKTCGDCSLTGDITKPDFWIDLE